jgi:hypothetical protein
MFNIGDSVEYKGFKGKIGFITSAYVTIISPSVINNPWPITVIVHRSDLKKINEIPSDLQTTEE